ncbi:BnaC01g36380D [Brassica napus]|uniref:BnaC01g36380D protein n=1 Tax=Brassica napus TaxID=3708 RepID=A0A078H4J1_BRANA|nr:BnaC01g36380D [Brassica napus]
MLIDADSPMVTHSRSNDYAADPEIITPSATSHLPCLAIYNLLDLEWDKRQIALQHLLIN